MNSGLLGRLRRVAALLRDPRVPRLPRFAVVLAVLYLLWPADLVPELISPLFGLIDDATLLWLSIRWLHRSGDEVAGPQPRG